MNKPNALLAKLVAIVFAIPLFIGALYAWPFHSFRSITLYGFVGGVFLSATLAFYLIRPTKGLVVALGGSLAVGSIVFFLAWFYIANLTGEYALLCPSVLPAGVSCPPFSMPGLNVLYNPFSEVTPSSPPVFLGVTSENRI
jgi:hypothetical protein